MPGAELKIERQNHYVDNYHAGFRCRIEVMAVNNLPSEKLFAYIAVPVAGESGIKKGQFSHVCSATDLEEFPEDDPDPQSAEQFFRASVVDLVVPTKSIAEDFVSLVTTDVEMLVNTYQQFTDMSEETVVIGDMP
jgi:hypothetical protein